MKRKFTAVVLLFLLFVTGCCSIFLKCKPSVLTVGVYAGSYWNTPNGNCYQILDDAIALFHKKYPDIQVRYVSGIGIDSYSEWLAEQILQGTEPDLYFVLPDDFNLLASAGALEQLDHFISDDPDFHPDAYYNSCLQAGRFNGGQYALPQESVPTLMFVNKTLLESCGIPMPDNHWTWDDFYQICSQVTDLDNKIFGVYGYTWLNALYANGAALFSEDGSACYLADEKVQTAIHFTSRLHELNGGYTVSSRDFDLGRVAFRPFLFSEYRAYQPYPWRVKKYSGFQWDCVCMPAGPEGDNVSELHTMLLGISARSKQKERVWELAKLLSLDENIQSELYSNSHGISPVWQVAEEQNELDTLDLPSGFTPEVIHKIMNDAAVVSQFEKSAQAMIMAEKAVAEFVEGNNQQNCLLTAQREITIYLNQ